MVWADIKSKLRKYNQSPELSESVVNNIRTVVDEINKSDIWRACVSHVIKKESEYCSLPPITPIIISVNNDSSSENSDSEA